MVVIFRKKNEGKTRTCNAKCYNAKGQVCACICEGTNHGVGMKGAIENTTEMIRQIEVELQLPLV